MRRSRRELSNEYLRAKFGFDTAENDEPCKVCPLSAYRFLQIQAAGRQDRGEHPAADLREERGLRRRWAAPLAPDIGSGS